MCWLDTPEKCDEKMAAAGGFLQQTIYFTVPYATTKVRFDEFTGSPEVSFSVEFIGYNNEKRNNILNPLQGGFATTSMMCFIQNACIIKMFSIKELRTSMCARTRVMKEQRTMSLLIQVNKN